MRLIFFPTQDSSIYEEFDWRNAGHDEILEVGKAESGQFNIRSLIQFDIISLSSSISDGTIPNNALFDLKLFVARTDDLQIGQNINIHEVSRSWVEGSGYFYQNTNIPYTSSRSPDGGFFEDDGVTWKNRQSASLWSTTGSEFYTGSVLSGTIADPVVDMIFDISQFIRDMVSGTISNNGFVLKFPSSDELNLTVNGNIKFFSRQTHTIYLPQLIAKWDDQQYITGSISGSSPSDTSIVPRNVQPKYKLSEIVRVDLSVRNKYPLKTFDTVFTAWTGNQRLPSSSYFSIIDVQSNTTIIPFDQYSKISSDGSGSYFNFRVDGMYPGRFYKMMFKIIDQDYTKIYDSNNIFSVESV